MLAEYDSDIKDFINKLYKHVVSNISDSIVSGTLTVECPTEEGICFMGNRDPVKLALFTPWQVCGY